MGQLIKRFPDGSFLEYDRGGFDDWCVYLTSASGNRRPPRDTDYFTQLKELAERFGTEKVYSDYVKVYDLTGKQVDRDSLEKISILSKEYGASATQVDTIFSILYMAMIAEERKAGTRLGKRIKRLGIHKLLIENIPVREAANFMRGMGWRVLLVFVKNEGFKEEQMPRYEITKFFSNSGSRNEVRMRVVDALAAETPGTGNGEDASKYIYYVETLNSGDRVYLQRPANLHNGFDFLVCVENANYALPGQRRRNFPKHEDLAADLQAKKAENEEMYARLHGLLRRVFECEDVSDDEMEAIHFSTGLPVDHILKAIKWLFIEQDIRYWNYSGRNMTWGLVPPVDMEV